MGANRSSRAAQQRVIDRCEKEDEPPALEILRQIGTGAGQIVAQGFQ